MRAAKAMTMATRVASDGNKEGSGNSNEGGGWQEGNCDGSKSNGNGDMGGGQAIAMWVIVAMTAMVTATAMARATATN